MAISAARRARLETLTIARQHVRRQQELSHPTRAAVPSEDIPVRQESAAASMPIPPNHLCKLEDNRIQTEKPQCECKMRCSPYSHRDNASPCIIHAESALRQLELLLNPHRNRGAGHKKCKLNEVTQARCRAMTICLRSYLEPGCTFQRAAIKAAKVLGRGQQWYARRIRQWVRRFMSTGELPPNRYGRSLSSKIGDERVAGDIRLYLQAKGEYVCAEDMVKHLEDAEVQKDLGLQKSISINTARRWLHELGYKWRTEPKGQYFDGHERIDVVEYRTKVYIPAWQSIEPFLLSWDGKTGVALPSALPNGQRRIVVWFHDESIFRSNDRQKWRWVKNVGDPFA
ncbi:Son of sevenless [Ceratobasidium sp. AG-Ba]|nr:Son of sevenless [Ceratobasidium sp. AG-Ba]